MEQSASTKALFVFLAQSRGRREKLKQSAADVLKLSRQRSLQRPAKIRIVSDVVTELLTSSSIRPPQRNLHCGIAVPLSSVPKRLLSRVSPQKDDCSGKQQTISPLTQLEFFGADLALQRVYELKQKQPYRNPRKLQGNRLEEDALKGRQRESKSQRSLRRSSSRVITPVRIKTSEALLTPVLEWKSQRSQSIQRSKASLSELRV